MRSDIQALRPSLLDEIVDGDTRVGVDHEVHLPTRIGSLLVVDQLGERLHRAHLPGSLRQDETVQQGRARAG